MQLPIYNARFIDNVRIEQIFALRIFLWNDSTKQFHNVGNIPKFALTLTLHIMPDVLKRDLPSYRQAPILTMEHSGFEPLTSSMPLRRSTN